MITSITIENFKSLEKVNLSLGNLNLFIGTNASGKSNFFDALRVLQGIGYGFTIDEIFNGKPKSASSEVWQPIRGGSSKAAFFQRGDSNRNSEQHLIHFSVTLQYPDNSDKLQYSLVISTEKGCIVSEKLLFGNETIFDSELNFEKSKPILHQFIRNYRCSELQAKYIEYCIRTLSNIQHFSPNPDILRDYSQAHTAKRMGDRGENFAALVKTIISDEKEKNAFVSWLKELTPNELDDVSILEGALGEPLFALKDGNISYPAPILSDGTLKFAAITAAFFQPDMSDIITIEEIENGIHPNRLRLLVELLKNQSKSSQVQIMATTHSPLVLDWLDREDYQNTFVCKRDEDTGATRILPLSEIPHFLKLTPKHPVGELFAEGWFEGVL